jgi:hypothetical protein
MAEPARYAYAVTRGLDTSALEGGLGLRGAALEIVSSRGLDAVVGDVPLEEFSEEALTRNLESLSWLEDVARGHDDVVRLVAARGPTAPLRLATIFHDDAAVRDRLEEWHDSIVDVLDRVEGRAEWSVKVIAPLADAVEADTTRPTSGAEFLRRRKAQADERGRRVDEGGQVAEEVHALLSRTSVASRVLPAQDPQLTGHTGTMVLNGAYLVESAERERFERELAEVRGRFPDVELEAGGPWPPYSFAVLEQP